MATITVGEMSKKLTGELKDWIEKGFCTLDTCENMLSEYLDEHIINIDPMVKVFIIEKAKKGATKLNDNEFRTLESKLKGFADDFKVITIEEYVDGLDLTPQQQKKVNEIIDRCKARYKEKYGVSWEEDNNF